MTNKQLVNRVKKLQSIEAQMKELEEQADAIRAEIKSDLEAKGEDEHDTRVQITHQIHRRVTVARQKKLCKSRQGTVKGMGANRRSKCAEHSPA